MGAAMRSELQKASSHCNWTIRMIKGLIGTGSWLFNPSAKYVSRNTLLKWISISDQMAFLIDDLKKDYREYKASQTSEDS